MNSSGWIIGAEATRKISTIFDEYSHGCIERAKICVGPHIDTYHPILGDLSAFSNLPDHQHNLFFKLGPIENWGAKNLDLLKPFFESRIYMGSLYGDSAQYKIEPNLGTSVPGGNEELRDALRMLRLASEWQSMLLDSIISQIIPMTNRNQFRFIGGASDYHFIGLIFSGLKPKPFGKIRLAISIAHELGHNALFTLQKGENPFDEKEMSSKVYSGVRKTDRPVLASLHAAVALSYMISFCNGAIENLPLDNDELNFLTIQRAEFKTELKKGLLALKKITKTFLGELIFFDLLNVTEK